MSLTQLPRRLRCVYKRSLAIHTSHHFVALLSVHARMVQDMIGKDLSRVCLPVYFNEPLSMLQKMPEDVEYSELVDKVRLPSFSSCW